MTKTSRLPDRPSAIAEERPVAMVYNDIAHAVMMATPEDLQDFGLGFSLSEGIIDDPSQIFDIAVEETAKGISLNIELAAEPFALLKARRRALVGRTGCGLCGLESLEAFDQVLTLAGSVPRGAPVASRAIIHKAQAALRDQQRIFKETGAVHAAAWVDLTQGIQVVREDVGRHNAFDKLIGALRARSMDLTQGFALLTSRASYEMVHKAVRQGMGLLAVVSAPTSLAIEIADRSGLTLIGFVRDTGMTVYTHPERLSDE